MRALVATLRLRVRNEHAKPGQSAPRRVRLLSQEQGRDPRDRLYPLLARSATDVRVDRDRAETPRYLGTGCRRHLGTGLPRSRECDRHERRPPTPCLSSGSAASVLARRAAVFQGLVRPVYRDNGHIRTPDEPRFPASPPAGYSPSEHGPSGPVSRRGVDASGSEDSLDQSGAVSSTQRVNAGGVAAHTSINGQRQSFQNASIAARTQL